jgi:uncharacterized membrane protein
MHSHGTPTRITSALTTPPPQSLVAHTLWARIGLLALLLLAFALRLYHLGSESLWYDETVSAYLATQPVSELIAHTARDIHPPAYYLLLHAWRLLTQPTVAFGLEYLYAWPNVALGLLVVALTFVLAKRFLGTVTAYWALSIAILHPFQLWFAQEVRMYALGALCVMLTLWAFSSLFTDPASHKHTTSISRRMSVLYVIASLIGLYTLYYFLFWLVTLNLCVLLQMRQKSHLFRTWLLLQLLVLLGWLPWLPIFLHQAITPPVPTWRIPWQNSGEIFSALSEGIGAFWIGALWITHTPTLATTWPWAVTVIIVATLYIVYTKSISLRTRAIMLLLCFGPFVLLFVVSLIGPPIYHVRYLATYAPIFALLLGALLAHLKPLLARGSLVAIALVSGITLYQLWSNPIYAADDHRSAVATLAQQWRPGDLILVNAGWVYTALSLYWPTELATPHATRPPDIAAMPRLMDMKNNEATLPIDVPILVRSGIVDGSNTLGWELPESDFFAISATDTTEALEQLANNSTRIWHYRLYDTVSDPNTLIRSWLQENSTLESSQPFPGPGYLLVENYRINRSPTPPQSTTTIVEYPDTALNLINVTHPPTLPAGETLYVTLTWQDTAPSSRTTAPALSLRLYDARGQFVLQSDTPIATNATGISTQALALPIRATTIPGDYTLSLLVYDRDTLAPHSASTAEGTSAIVPTPLGQLTVTLPSTIPHTEPPLASFDYIDLLEAALPTTPLAPASSFTTAWTWRPRPSTYSDHYTAHIQLFDQNFQPVTRWEFALGTEIYPSSVWPPSYPLMQRIESTLPSTLPPGIYQIHLSLTRTSDSQLVSARRPWQPWKQPAVRVGQIEIVAAQ